MAGIDGLSDLIPERSPWWDMPDDLAEAYTRELRKELGVGHRLFERVDGLRAIAKCEANDDALFMDLNDPDVIHLIHLTWSGKTDMVPEHFPTSMTFKRSELATFFRDY